MNIKQMFVGATICLSSLGFTFVTLPEEAWACNSGLSLLDPTCPGEPLGPLSKSRETRSRYRFNLNPNFSVEMRWKFVQMSVVVPCNDPVMADQAI